MDSFTPANFKILIVEDSSIQAEMLKRILQGAGYQLALAKNGVEGLALANQLQPDLILSDVNMPLMNGFELCSAIRQDPVLGRKCVIMLTALTDITDVIKALNAGADNYLSKPYKTGTLLGHVRHSLVTQAYQDDEKQRFQACLPDGSIHKVWASPRQMLNLLVSTYGNVVEQNKELLKIQDEVFALNISLTDKVRVKSDELNVSELKIRQTLLDSIEAIASTVEMRDPYTAGHQRDVAEIAVLIGQRLGLPEEMIFGLRIAGIVHDLGKINTPAEILNKPGKLSKNQYALVQEHPEAGYNTLKNIDFPWPIANIVYQHHERLDGSGYPNGLKADEILLEAKILAVADLVDAMSSHRPYRPSLGLSSAREELLKNRGKLYDPEIVDACLQLMDEQQIISHSTTEA